MALQREETRICHKSGWQYNILMCLLNVAKNSRLIEASVGGKSTAQEEKKMNKTRRKRKFRAFCHTMITSVEKQTTPAIMVGMIVRKRTSCTSGYFSPSCPQLLLFTTRIIKSGTLLSPATWATTASSQGNQTRSISASTEGEQKESR